MKPRTKDCFARRSKCFFRSGGQSPQKPLKCTSCPHQISQALGLWGGRLKKVPQAMHSRQFYKFLRGWHTMTGRGGRGQCWEIIPSISDPLMTGKLRWPGAHAAPHVNWASNGGKLRFSWEQISYWSLKYYRYEAQTEQTSVAVGAPWRTCDLAQLASCAFRRTNTAVPASADN